MAYDQIRPIKMESPAEGGTQLDTSYNELNPLNDALTSLGHYVQELSLSAADTQVLLDRINGSMRMTDTVTSRKLSELVTNQSGAVASHNALADIIHYLSDNGPGDAYASGAVCQNTYSNALLTSQIWYTSSSLQTKIFSIQITYSGVFAQAVVRTLYNTSGVAVRTMTDTFTYSNYQVSSVSRTWS